MSLPRAKILESKLLFAGPVFGVRRDRLIEPGGVRVTRDVVTHTGSIVLLPLASPDCVLLIRQYRHAVRQSLWELVAGRIEPGEGPLAAARRELMEETGYTARRFRKLLDIFSTPGFVSERMIVYTAEGLAAGQAAPEEDERIEARPFTWPQLEAMIRSGRLRDAKSIAALLFYDRFRRRGAPR